MRKAVLKTLIYADIFDYPLKINEIQKWLIGKKANIRQVEKAIKRLNQESRIPTESRTLGETGVKNYGNYFCLQRRDKLITKRHLRERQSANYLKKAQIISQVLKVIPWIKLVGISGGLAMENAEKKDDIDLFVITAKNRLWISRLCALGILTLTGQRRKKGELKTKLAGKLCLNILLEEDKLEQKSQDIFVAHEVLQMRVLWQRDGIYRKYLSDNEWVFKFLPNWITNTGLMIKDERLKRKNHQSLIINHKSFAGYLENFAKWIQLKIMQQPQGMERIEDGALYFHPNDIREEILKKYKNIISP